ncbi:MAG: hypothetical protein ACM3Q2_17925 [Syntrophothermus sp.]
MKKDIKGKKKRPYLLILFLAGISASVIVYLYVSLNIEIEKLTKLKANRQDELATLKNVTLKLQVEIQKLEGEERITSIAESTLNMTKFNEPGTIVEIDHNKADQITKLIESKYE